MANDYTARGTFGYNRITNDAKIIYNPSDKTSIFGRYSIEPFSLTDPQVFGKRPVGAAGAVDGGQPGQASGRIQNVGLGASHVITPNLVVDADFGYTRQVTGAQSLIDIADGDFGLNTLGIPGTNGVGHQLCGPAASSVHRLFDPGQRLRRQPFLFRDNQFTGDVNVSWTKGKHATKYGFTYYHFDLNHFQPTSRRRRQQSARRLHVPGEHDQQHRHGHRLQRTGRLPARPAQQRHRHRCSQELAVVQPQLPALDRTRRLCAGPVDGHPEAHHQLRRSL